MKDRPEPTIHHTVTDVGFEEEDWERQPKVNEFAEDGSPVVASPFGTVRNEFADDGSRSCATLELYQSAVPLFNTSLVDQTVYGA